MQAFILFSAVCFIGCVSAAPCSSPCYIPPPNTCSNSAYSFFRTYYCSSYSYNYYAAEMCLDYGISTIPGYLPTIMLEDLEYEFNYAKCKLLQRYSCFPRNIGPILNQFTSEQLMYDYIFFGASTTTFFAVQQLAALGKRIAVVDTAAMYSPLVNSMYYRHALLNSQYVRPFKGYIPQCGVTKNLYASNMVGGLSMIDYQCWDLGYRGFYDKFAQYNSQFSWDNAYSYYQKYEHCEKKETCTKVECGPCGQMSITKTVRETSVTKSVNNVFSELGYTNYGAAFDINRSQGLSYLPYIGCGNELLNIPEYIFSNIQNIQNIDFILNVQIEQLLLSGGIASGLRIIGPNGPVTIGCTSEIILGSSPLLIYELLVKSGCAPINLLNTLGIPPQIELPYLGSSLMVTPNYCGSFMRVPCGTFIQEFESDYTAMAFAFGENYFSSSASMNYYKAYFAVGGSVDVNVQLNFHIFSKYMSKRLQLELLYYFQLDEFAVQYVLDMCNSYDLIFFSYTLLDSLSTGYITYKSSFTELDLNLGMYTNQYDIDCMLETIEISRLIAQTSIFSTLGAELMQLPLSGYPGQFFTSEVNLQSLYYHSFPSFNLGGILSIGTDISNSVVNTNLYIHGMNNLRVLSNGISPFAIPFESMAFNSFLANYATNLIINGGSSSYNSYSSNTRSLSSGPLGSGICPGPGPIPCPPGPGPIPCPPGPGPIPCPPGPGPIPCPPGPGPIPCPPGPGPIPCPPGPGPIPCPPGPGPIPCPPGPGPIPCPPGPGPIPCPPGPGPIPCPPGPGPIPCPPGPGPIPCPPGPGPIPCPPGPLPCGGGSGSFSEYEAESIMESGSSGLISNTRSLGGGSGMGIIDQSSSSFVEGAESCTSFNNGLVSGSSFSESQTQGSEYEFENTVVGPNGVTSVCAEGSEYSTSQKSGSTTVIGGGCGC